MNDSVQTKAEAIEAVYDISAMKTPMIEAYIVRGPRLRFSKLISAKTVS